RWVTGTARSLLQPFATSQNAMRMRRQLRAYFGDARRIDIADDDSGALLALGDDSAPRVDQHRMPVRAAPARMRPTLRRGQYVALVFDGAGSQQQVPMRSAGGRRERRGHEDQCEIAETSVELGEADVVAYRQAYTTAGKLDCDGLRSRFDRAALVVALVLVREREQVDLVVARHAGTVRSIDEACATHARRTAAGERPGAAGQPDAVAPSFVGEKSLLRAIALGLAYGDFVRRTISENAEIFGQHDESRAGGSGFGDQL